MKRALILSVVAAMASMAFAAEETAKTVIKKSHTQFEKALLTRDAKAAKKVVMDYFLPDFSYKPLRGKSMNRDAFITNMGINPTVKFTTFKFSYGKFSVKGNTVTVPVNVDVKASMTDPQGKAHTMAGKSVDLETWVKSGSTWKMKAMVSQKEQQTLDGKAMKSG